MIAVRDPGNLEPRSGRQTFAGRVKAKPKAAGAAFRSAAPFTCNDAACRIREEALFARAGANIRVRTGVPTRTECAVPLELTA